MIKTVLVPIDISEKQAGGAALALARDFAELKGATLVLLNVVEEVPGFVATHLPAGFHEQAVADAAEALEAIAGRNQLGETAEIVVRTGTASTEILGCASDIGADMIVVASHDPGLVDYLLGSVAARVVRHAHCSVLVARKLDD